MCSRIRVLCYAEFIISIFPSKSTSRYTCVSQIIAIGRTWKFQPNDMKFRISLHRFTADVCCGSSQIRAEVAADASCILLYCDIHFVAKKNAICVRLLHLFALYKQATAVWDRLIACHACWLHAHVGGGQSAVVNMLNVCINARVTTNDRWWMDPSMDVYGSIWRQIDGKIPNNIVYLYERRVLSFAVKDSFALRTSAF